MANSPYTGVEHIEPNQAQKEVTANNGFDRLSRFVAETTSITISGDRLLTEQEFQEAVRFDLGGTPGSGFLFEVPSTVKKIFIVNNQTDADATVQVTGGGGASVVVGVGDETLLYSDDTDITVIGGGGADVGKALVSSNDTTLDYLINKLVAGSNITLTENNDGGNETLTITSTASGGGGSSGAGGVLNWSELALVNGGFEDATDLAGWTVNGSATATGTGAGTGFVDISAIEGSQFLKHATSDSSDFWVEQEVACDAPNGGLVLLTLAVAEAGATGDTPFAYMEARDAAGGTNLADTGNIEFPGFGEDVWAWVHYWFELPSGTSHLLIRVGGLFVTGSITNVAIDDVNAYLFATPPGFQGAVASKTSAESLSGSNSSNILSWDSEDYDEGGWHDNVTNNSRLTVPSDVTRVRVGFHLDFDTPGSGAIQAFIQKNGSTGSPGLGGSSVTAYSGSELLSYISPVLEVTAGDYFEVEVLVDDSGGGQIDATSGTRFFIEAVPDTSGGSGSGVSLFEDLTDTPNSYTGEAGRGLAVTSGEDGLEFVDLVTNYDELSDVNLSGLTNGDVPQWNGTAWVNLPLLAASRPVNQPWKGAFATLTADDNNLTFPYIVPWDQASIDTDSFWDSGSPERFTIPSGVTKVRLRTRIEMGAEASDAGIFLGFRKNGSTFDLSGDINWVRSTGGFNNNIAYAESSVLEVTSGDYFEVRVNPDGFTQDDILQGESYFELEVLETSDAEAPPYEFKSFTQGLPGASELVYQEVIARPVTLPSGLTDSQGYAGTAPADGAKDFDVQKNGSSVGTVSFANGSNTATFTMASATQFAAGDRLALVAPGTQDSAMADVSITLAGTRD
jgi:hypothetical protein